MISTDSTRKKSGECSAVSAAGVTTEFKKAAKELSDAAFDYAGVLRVTEYRYPDEELIFIDRADPKDGETSVMRLFRAKYDRSGAEKLREVTRRLSNIAAFVSKEIEPILAYSTRKKSGVRSTVSPVGETTDYTYKTDVDKELKTVVANLIDTSFEYLDMLDVSVFRKADSVDIFIKKRDINAKDRTLIYKKVRYDEADGAMAVRDIISEIPKLAAEVSAETEYPRLEKTEPKEPEKPLFFRKKVKKAGQV